MWVFLLFSWAKFSAKFKFIIFNASHYYLENHSTALCLMFVLPT